MKKIILCLITIFIYSESISQKVVDDFFYLNETKKEIPIRLRGTLENNIILIFVQGGPGENALDFARIDYPYWKTSLENKVAIAYYDQRGLNQKVKRIDQSKITHNQYSLDIIAISRLLKEKYKADIYLLGHSAGGRFIYHCLASYHSNKDIKGAITMNTPITTDYSPERYNHYRPLYLKNLASEFIKKKVNTKKWQEALDWMREVDSIHSPDISRRWNAYVDSAFDPTKRKIKIGEAVKVIFGKPYNPFKYFYQKDNELVSELLWRDTEHLDFFKLLPQINHPMLILTGRFDDIAPPEEQKVADKLMKNSKAVILLDAGHESFLDQPEKLTNEVLHFIGL